MKARYRFTKPVSAFEEKQLTLEHWGGMAFTFQLIIEVPLWIVGIILFNVFPPGVPLMMAGLVALAAIIVYRDRKRLKPQRWADRSIRELRRLVQRMPLPKEAHEVVWDWDASIEGNLKGMIG